MSRILSINSNVASLNSQRQLGRSTQTLQDTFTRLSSGLRINKASDDAAGLAISESLLADARVFAQGIRNINDGLSLLNIYEGALNDLSTILTRQIELAEQASNGLYSSKQRSALHEEANALVEEYNRIVATIEFNGRNILENIGEELRVQAGYGISGSVAFALGDELARNIGTGTYQADVFYASAGNPNVISGGDFNGDGINDIISGQSSGVFRLYIGNGDGSFQASSSVATIGGVGSVIAADVNNDGKLDVVAGSSSVEVFLGNGDGTFQSRILVASMANANDRSAVGDLNNDGNLDIITPGSVALGNGDGTFQAGFAFDSSAAAREVELGDFNNDGYLDAVLADSTDQTASIVFGRGDGTFGPRISFSAVSTPGSVAADDFNDDGIADFAVARTSSTLIDVYISNGDGTFKTPDTYVGVGSSLDSADINGDGYADLVSSLSSGTVNVFFSNGDGTFQSRLSSSVTSAPAHQVLLDFNGDGVVDIGAASSGNQIAVLLGNSNRTATQARMRLHSQKDALAELAPLRAAFNRVTQERGAIGAAQSRLETAINNLQIAGENYNAAASRIRDVDVAKEASELIRQQVLQQAGMAVLSQANQQPTVALRLLRG